MKTCYSCQAKIISQAQFCSECGSDLSKIIPQDEATASFCRKCGSGISLNTPFCRNCGTEVSFVTSPQVAKRTRHTLTIMIVLLALITAAVIGIWQSGMFGKRGDNSQNTTVKLKTGDIKNHNEMINASMSNLKQLSFALMMFASDHNEQLPNMSDYKTLENDLLPYVKNTSIFYNPRTNQPYVSNDKVSGRRIGEFDDPSKVFVLHEEITDSHNMRVVAFLDGKVRCISETIWNEIQLTSNSITTMVPGQQQKDLSSGDQQHSTTESDFQPQTYALNADPATPAISMVTIPSVVKLSCESAIQRLRNAGLVPLVEGGKLWSDSVPINCVIRTSPSASNGQVQRGTTIRITLSNGSQPECQYCNKLFNNKSEVEDHLTRQLYACSENPKDCDFIAKTPSEVINHYKSQSNQSLAELISQQNCRSKALVFGSNGKWRVKIIPTPTCSNISKPEIWRLERIRE